MNTDKPQNDLIETHQRGLKQEIISWTGSIIVALIITFIIRNFIGVVCMVDGISMESTLHDRELIVVSKLERTKNIDRGEVVIFKGSKSKDYFVKRLIAKPGDTVEIVDDILFVNKKRVPEPYINSYEDMYLNDMPIMEDLHKFTVPEGEYFVMGDNRMYSTDSRNGLGLAKEENIVGVGKLVFYPFNNTRLIN